MGTYTLYEEHITYKVRHMYFNEKNSVLIFFFLQFKAIHTSPEDAELWKAMAVHLLNYHRETEARLLASAANCAQKSAGLCRDDSSSMMSLVGFCLLNGADKMSKTYKMAVVAAKRAAIKAIHCYPQNLEPWSVLLAAVDAEVVATTQGILNFQHWDHL